jgi:hypothetical protein
MSENLIRKLFGLGLLAAALYFGLQAYEGFNFSSPGGGGLTPVGMFRMLIAFLLLFAGISLLAWEQTKKAASFTKKMAQKGWAKVSSPRPK